MTQTHYNFVAHLIGAIRLKFHPNAKFRKLITKIITVLPPSKLHVPNAGQDAKVLSRGNTRAAE